MREANKMIELINNLATWDVLIQEDLVMLTEIKEIVEQHQHFSNEELVDGIVAVSLDFASYMEGGDYDQIADQLKVEVRKLLKATP